MAADRIKEAAQGPTKAPPASGCLFVLAAPSGGGKTSLVAALLEREPGIRLSVSYTTRRRARANGRAPITTSSTKPGFLELKAKGEFLEHAHVHGNWYATSATWLGDRGGAWPGRAARNRLAGGGAGPSTHSGRGPHLHPAAVARARCASASKSGARTAPAVIARRLEAAREEMRHCGEFDYVIMNQEFATSRR